MCDTFFIPSDMTEEGFSILAKNSDRPFGESQKIELSFLESGKSFFGVPFWMSGCEMGVNSYGVAGGNEALFTRLKPEGRGGLTGMEILRSALEVSLSAEQTAEKITELVEKKGQDTNSAYGKEMRYNNSFLIAGDDGTFYIETIKRGWAMKKVRSFFAISNEMIFGTDYEKANLEPLAHEMDFPKAEEKPDMKKTFEDRVYTFFSGARIRRSKILERIVSLKKTKGKLSVRDCVDILRIHEKTSVGIPSPGVASVCMHSLGPLSPSETANSMVALLRDDVITVWFTGTPHACLSLFKPFFLFRKDFSSEEEKYMNVWMKIAGMLSPSEVYDRSLWWTAWRIHSFVFLLFPKLEKNLREKIQKLQDEIFDIELKTVKRGRGFSELTVYALRREVEILRYFEDKIGGINAIKKLGAFLTRPMFSLWRFFHMRRYYANMTPAYPTTDE